MGVIKLNWREMGRGIGKEKGGEVEGEEVPACFLWGRRELLKISIMKNHKELLYSRIFSRLSFLDCWTPRCLIMVVSIRSCKTTNTLSGAQAQETCFPFCYNLLTPTKMKVLDTA